MWDLLTTLEFLYLKDILDSIQVILLIIMYTQEEVEIH